ncbi:MAG: tripartite tricarboxylate transporter substrate binding protein [Rhodospirillales bacterium]|nr:tripartite tricarboxylate transporter substrate binding protein [Rhodospirillales bacterium]
MKNLGRRGVVAAGAALALSPAVRAQGAWPDRPIKFVVGFPAGGATDVVGRLLGQAVGERLSRQVIIENKPGAAGNIGSALVADSKPDGYTFLVGNSIMSIVPALYDKLGYDPVNSLDAVAHFTTVPMIIMAPAGGVKSLEELVALLRKEPGKHSYPSPGNGSLIHISSLLFTQRVAAEAMHVPYRGSAPATQDTLAGRHSFQIDAPGSVKGFIDSGRLTVLAVCAEKRLSSLPSVPTVEEKLGFPFNVSTWNMIFAPAGTPRPIVDRLNAIINEAIQSPELIEKAKPLEIEFVQSTPASAKAFYERQMAFWVPIVKASGAKVE